LLASLFAFVALLTLEIVLLVLVLYRKFFQYSTYSSVHEVVCTRSTPESTPVVLLLGLYEMWSTTTGRHIQWWLVPGQVL
jgi:hypothetical protein